MKLGLKRIMLLIVWISISTNLQAIAQVNVAGPVGHWSFNDRSGADHSGNGNFAEVDESQYYNKENEFIILLNYFEKTIYKPDIISITVLETFETYCLV